MSILKIYNISDKKDFLGFGIYVGKHLPVEATNPISKIAVSMNIPVDTAVIESGEFVYASECFFELPNNDALAITEKPNTTIKEIRNNNKELNINWKVWIQK